MFLFALFKPGLGELYRYLNDLFLLGIILINDYYYSSLLFLRDAVILSKEDMLDIARELVWSVSDLFF